MGKSVEILVGLWEEKNSGARSPSRSAQNAGRSISHRCSGLRSQDEKLQLATSRHCVQTRHPHATPGELKSERSTPRPAADADEVMGDGGGEAGGIDDMMTHNTQRTQHSAWPTPASPPRHVLCCLGCGVYVTPGFCLFFWFLLLVPDGGLHGPSEEKPHEPRRHGPAG